MTDGRIRNAVAYAKNGTTPSQASGTRRRPAPEAGRAARATSAMDSGLGPQDLRAPLFRDQLLRLREAELEVVPVDRDRGLSRGDRLPGDVDRHEVADLRELREEIDPRLDVGERAAVGERGRVDARKGGVSLTRVVVERDLVLVFGLQQVTPVLRDVLDDVGVRPEPDHSPVVAGPEPTRVLHQARNRRVVSHLVIREEPLLCAADRKRGPDVNDVRSPALAL